ncbi:MAG: alpha/beta hydrolase [Candidatus Lokiarchaeota archaeon]|nr:alpha/beta hydrolase [Candidatus Lokiarchaeota archaeon]
MILDGDEIAARVFYPRREAPPREIPGKLEVFSFPFSPSGRIGGLFFTRDPGLPTMLLFHGNGEVVNDYIHSASEYMDCGVNLAVVDYRGYGFSDGSPSFGALLEDSRVAYDAVRGHILQRGFDPRVVVFGRSLGSACAAEIGAGHPPGLSGVIFESGFGDLFNIMNRLFGVGVLMGVTRDKLVRYSNDTKVKQFTTPVLIIHGTEDFIIPVAEADVLFNSVPDGVPKRRVIIDGAGHNDILMWADEYFPPIKDFVREIGGRP